MISDSDDLVICNLKYCYKLYILYFLENYVHDFGYFGCFPQNITQRGSSLRTKLCLILQLRTKFGRLNFQSTDRVLLTTPFVLQQHIFRFQFFVLDYWKSVEIGRLITNIIIIFDDISIRRNVMFLIYFLFLGVVLAFLNIWLWLIRFLNASTQYDLIYIYICIYI